MKFVGSALITSVLMQKELWLNAGMDLNDCAMLKEEAIGIAVIRAEGASAKPMASADIVVRDICCAIDCIFKPLRMIATLCDWCFWCQSGIGRPRISEYSLGGPSFDS